MKITSDHLSILRNLRKRGVQSRKQIADACGISLTKTTGLISELQTGGLLIAESGISQGGRTPSVVQVRPDLFYTVGIDIGTENVRAALFDLKGSMLASVRRREANIEAPRSLPVSLLTELVNQVCAEAHAPFARVGSIGVGITGIVHEKEGRCLSLRNTPLWKNLDVAAELRRETGLETVMVMDSVRAMAVAEERYGAARGLTDFVVFNLGIGLGAGIVLNGQLVSGDRGTTGEFGHMHVRRGNDLCVCGNYGCLEATASGWALLRRCREALANGVEMSLGEGVTPSSLSVDRIIAAADSGDKVSLRFLETMAEDVSMGIGSVINILNPQKTILSGGVIRHARAHMLDAILRGIRATVIPWLQQNIVVEVSQLGEWDAALGAAQRVADLFIDRQEDSQAFA